MPEDTEPLETQMTTEDSDSEQLNDAAAVQEGTEKDEEQTSLPNVNAQNVQPTNVVVTNSSWHKSARDEEPYDFELCTVLVMLQIMPPREGQAPDARQVFLSARTHSDPPCVMRVQWSELEPRLPEEIKILVSRVQTELPQRAAAQEAERQRLAQLRAASKARRAVNTKTTSTQTTSSLAHSTPTQSQDNATSQMNLF